MTVLRHIVSSHDAHVVCLHWLERKESHLHEEFGWNLRQIAHWGFVTYKFQLDLLGLEGVVFFCFQAQVVLNNGRRKDLS